MKLLTWYRVQCYTVLDLVIEITKNFNFENNTKHANKSITIFHYNQTFRLKPIFNTNISIFRRKEMVFFVLR